MININYQYLRFSENEGYPNSWMVFVMENPNLKWMMTGGTPVLGNPNMAYDIVLTNMNGFLLWMVAKSCRYTSIPMRNPL